MPVAKVANVKFMTGESTRLLLRSYRKEVKAYVADVRSCGPSLWGYQ